MTGKSDQTFSFEVVACLLAAIAESGTTVGNKHYALMAKIDGTKTQSGYEHMFRAAKNKAKDINDKLAKGELDVSTSPTKSGTPSGKGKGNGGSKAATLASGGRKRGRKAASEVDDEDDDESPTKKAKGEVKNEAEESEGDQYSGFYIAIAAIPASFALYKFSRQGTDEQPYFTRLIRDTYNGYKDKWTERNASHTRAMEQAAADRVIFLNESNNTLRRVDIRFPEAFNTGSPFNVPAGHGSANLDHLIAKYEKEAYEENERKLKQLRENNVPVEKEFESFRKLTPAAKDS
ncbi:hypothetical protein PRZ48_000959 [Zasmidium cellare]|uniref:Uncharacterized protein n=1 Tax=Zasmidium cellare TaxID=395010 RepID=A0ABR0F0V7_ZASCE|nr:hypothetical protein PRZ48_000959 [Zasmidium cellare]